MVVCDVGQGDAILIIKGSNQVLVDGGPSEGKLLACLGKYVPFFDRRIELIVLTNTDADHLRGLLAVVERYDVSRFVTSDGVHQSQLLDEMTRRLVEHGLQPQPVEQGDRVVVEGQGGANRLELRVLWPPETRTQYLAVFGDQLGSAVREQILGVSAKRGDLNERSVVMELLEGRWRVLLTGDIGSKTEKTLLDQGLLDDIDILKVGHHGSKYASSQEFLRVIKPEMAVVSAGQGNRYGHPTEEALERLRESGAQVKRTDKDGDVVLRLD